MIRAAAFDFDGTLVDSNPIKRGAFFEVARHLDPDGRVVEDVLQRFPRADRYRISEELARVLGGEADALAAAYSRHCEEAIARCDEIPGASAAIHALKRRGLRLYVNSATPLRELEKVIRRRSLGSHFEGIYGAPTSKAENLREISRRQKIPCSEIVVIGDGPGDREAAASLGCVFVAIAVDSAAPLHAYPGALPNLRGLPAALEELEASAAAASSGA